jgi:hypothetical protein
MTAPGGRFRCGLPAPPATPRRAYPWPDCPRHHPTPAQRGPCHWPKPAAYAAPGLPALLGLRAGMPAPPVPARRAAACPGKARFR